MCFHVVTLSGFLDLISTLMKLKQPKCRLSQTTSQVVFESGMAFLTNIEYGCEWAKGPTPTKQEIWADQIGGVDSSKEANTINESNNNTLTKDNSTTVRKPHVKLACHQYCPFTATSLPLNRAENLRFIGRPISRAPSL